MQILNDTIFLADVIAIAVMTHLIARCIREDSDKRYWRRRNEGRRKAYAAVYKRRCVRENRENLWRRFVK
jgi:hypothetical protein